VLELLLVGLFFVVVELLELQQLLVKLLLVVELILVV